MKNEPAVPVLLHELRHVKQCLFPLCRHGHERKEDSIMHCEVTSWRGSKETRVPGRPILLLLACCVSTCHDKVYYIHIYIYCIYICIHSIYIYMYIMYRHRTWTCHKYYIYIYIHMCMCVCVFAVPGTCTSYGLTLSDTSSMIFT